MKDSEEGKKFNAQIPIDKDNEFCQSEIRSLLSDKKENEVKVLINNIMSLGCPLPKGLFECIKCGPDSSKVGGFNINVNNDPDYKPKILLCEDLLVTKRVLSNALVHELVHAYDSCRANIDVTNCSEHACTEIRASALSGECSWFNELTRLKFGGKNECLPLSTYIYIQ